MKNLRFVSISKKQKREPSSFSVNRVEKRSHNLGKALGEWLGLLKTESASNIIFLNSCKDIRKDVKREIFL